MAITGASEHIRQAVLAWPGTSAHPHRFGGSEYRLGSREIGHIHGDGLVDIPFPKKVRDQIVSDGRAQPHHLLGDSGWVSFYLREPGDVERAIELLRSSYEIALRQKERRSQAAGPTLE
ncbi:MAG TPA: luciferase family protein [Anaerolineales bacterium]|nr:luciferase family protein [Anaerolineales bacterium]